MIRTIHRECQVRTPVMIVCKVPRKRTPEVALVEHDAVLADRQMKTVAAFLRSMPEVLWRTMERACTDMYEGFVRAIAGEVPWAEVVIDRIHVAQAQRDCANTVREKELKRLNSALPKAEDTELKRRCYGIFDMGSLFQRLTIDLHGHQLFGHI